MSETQENRLGFAIDEELTGEMLQAIEQIRLDPKRKDHVAALVSTVLKLTDVGLREFYVRPLEQAKVGTIALGTARVGVSTAKKGIAMVVNKLLRGMGEKQLRSIVDSMEGLLVRGS